jgi:hypothetical protein
VEEKANIVRREKLRKEDRQDSRRIFGGQAGPYFLKKFITPLFGKTKATVASIGALVIDFSFLKSSVILQGVTANWTVAIFPDSCR